MRYLIRIERTGHAASIMGPASAFLKGEPGKLKDFPSMEAAEEVARQLQDELAADDGGQPVPFVRYVAGTVEV